MFECSLKVLLSVRTTCVCDISSAVTLLLHADWIMIKNASNQRGANSVTVALSTRNPGGERLSLQKLYFWKILENYLAVSINLSVYQVFDLEAGRFKFLGENLLEQ